MGGIKLIGGNLPGMPWQDRPANCSETVWRFDGNPITGWNETKQTARIFNSAVIPYGDGYTGVFRADHKSGVMQLHVGRSADGVKWEFEDEMIHWKDAAGKPYDPAYGYDPRLVKIDDAYFVMWCTEFGGSPSIGLGMTHDFKSFVRLENAFLPCNRNGVLFPRKINGTYRLLSRPSDNGHTPFGDIYISESPDLMYWGKHRKVMSRSNSSAWQSMKIGAGPIPLETSEGWLMIYHGVVNTCSGYVYSMGAALLDLDEPSKVIYRTKEYLLTPEKPYETTGFVPNVAFPCATLSDAATGRIAIYYGAADTYIGIAFAHLEEVFDFMKSNSALMPGDAD